MFAHKSLGLLTGMIVAPRVAYRLFNRPAYNVMELPGGSALEHMAAKASHTFLYFFMFVMPASGIVRIFRRLCVCVCVFFPCSTRFVALYGYLTRAFLTLFALALY
jgi:cytochrome b561